MAQDDIDSVWSSNFRRRVASFFSAKLLEALEEALLSVVSQPYVQAREGNMYTITHRQVDLNDGEVEYVLIEEPGDVDVSTEIFPVRTSGTGRASVDIYRNVTVQSYGEELDIKNTSGYYEDGPVASAYNGGDYDDVDEVLFSTQVSGSTGGPPGGRVGGIAQNSPATILSPGGNRLIRVESAADNNIININAEVIERDQTDEELEQLEA